MPEHPAIKRGYATMSEVIEMERGVAPLCPKCGGPRHWIVSLVTSRLFQSTPDGDKNSITQKTQGERMRAVADRVHVGTTGGHIVASCDKCHAQEAIP